ncbi:MAG: mannitol dehydrogenase family protein, partial [Clostridia bacterium]|nr:mannitol dehydrogenase family protein [Clostridia bacterium]
RAFLCASAQKLLNEGRMHSGIIAAEGYDYEIIEKCYRPCDDYTLLVTLRADGSIAKEVIGSIAASYALDRENADDFTRMRAIFRSPSLQMASFTITEKGYALTPSVIADIALGPDKAQSYLGKVASLLYERWQAGCPPIAMVSMDNCSHNGDKLKAAMLAFADGWGDAGFSRYVHEQVTFPWTMIDKITPRPDAGVKEMLRRAGLEGLETIVTGKGTYIAPFVNAEESEYLVVEDDFPAGRPPLEEAGVIFTDRATVDRVERMKVCTCLNPLHTALAIFGCLLGYTRISEEMKDADLVRLVRRIGYDEGLPVVTDPGVIDPRAFIDTVVNVRLPNPFMPDSPQRIATDTSQKIAIRFGETIKACIAGSKPGSLPLRAIPFVLAGWLRYLMAVDDSGMHFMLSSDPMTEALRPIISTLHLGQKPDADQLLPLLKEKAIWGVDLTACDISGTVLDDLESMMQGPGAVRSALQRL